MREDDDGDLHVCEALRNAVLQRIKEGLTPLAATRNHRQLDL